MKREFTRRDFLEFMGRNAALATLAPSVFLQACAQSKTKNLAGNRNESHRYLSPSDADQLRLAAGLNYKVLISCGDLINSKEIFGSCNDFLAYFPLSEDGDEGLLCVNHENPLPLFVSGYSNKSIPKTKAQVEMEMKSVGVSILHVKHDGDWKIVPHSKFNRMVNANTKIPFSGRDKIFGAKSAIGTLGNCAGGKTPWGTYLTCEENFQDYYGEAIFDSKGERSLKSNRAYQWDSHYSFPPEHYGWVVEIDPKTAKAKKQVALGRFSHEGATVTLSADGRPVVYMGDDKVNEFIYKFIGAKKNSLESGTLYVANTESGKWLPLTMDNSILKAQFKSQTEVLIRAREAAKILGATPQNRPEDIEVCPRTKAVFVSLTNNSDKKDYFGSILKIVEKNNDPLALEFSSSTFLAGGEESGFACPDNLAFDPAGNLWITCDMPFEEKKRAPYRNFKNNGLYFVPMNGVDAGRAFLVATGPVESELTGPWFAPDGKSLFLSVQHPGELSKNLDSLTSHWPEGGNATPKSSVIVIQGEFLKQSEPAV